MRREGNPVRPTLGVLGHGGQALDGLPTPAIDIPERRVGERPHDLTHPVRAEVEADDRVARPDRSLAPNRCRSDELVGLASRIGAGDCLGGGGRDLLAPAMDQQIVCLLDPVPAGIAIHRPVPTDDRPDPCVASLEAPSLEFGHQALAEGRQRVATIGHRVNHDLGSAEVGTHRDQRTQMSPARVHSAIGGEAEQVNPRGIAEGIDQHRRLVELAIVNGVVDPSEVLGDDAARTKVEMTDLAVAHLPFRKPDSWTASDQRGVGKGIPERIEEWGLGEIDRVARAGRRKPPAVEDHEARPVDRDARRS